MGFPKRSIFHRYGQTRFDIFSSGHISLLSSPTMSILLQFADEEELDKISGFVPVAHSYALDVKQHAKKMVKRLVHGERVSRVDIMIQFMRNKERLSL